MRRCSSRARGSSSFSGCTLIAVLLEGKEGSCTVLKLSTCSLTRCLGFARSLPGPREGLRDVRPPGHRRGGGWGSCRVGVLLLAGPLAECLLPSATTVGGTSRCGPEKGSDSGPGQVPLWRSAGAACTSGSCAACLGASVDSSCLLNEVVQRSRPLQGFAVAGAIGPEGCCLRKCQFCEAPVGGDTPGIRARRQGVSQSSLRGKRVYPRLQCAQWARCPQLLLGRHVREALRQVK